MNKFKYSFLFVCFLIAQTAFAGGGGSVAGNGGDVLVCDDGSVQFFDIFEAESARMLKVDMGSSLSANEQVQTALGRIPRALEFWRNLLYQRLELFYARSVIGDFDLVDIPDGDNIFQKPGCAIQQAVIQRRPIAPDEPIFYISKKYWDQMDETSRAALILHEIIYYDAILNGHTNSRVTRLLNGYIMAAQTPIERSCLLARTLIGGELANLMRELLLGSLAIDASRAQITEDCRVSNAFVLRGNVTIGDQMIEPIRLTHTKYAHEIGLDGISMRDPKDIRFVHFDRNYHVNMGGYDVELAGARNSLWSQGKFWDYFRADRKVDDIDRPGFIYVGPEGNVLSASVERAVVKLFGQSILVRGELNFFSMGDRIDSIFFAPIGTITVGAQKLVVSKIEHIGQDNGAYRVHVPEGKRYSIRSSGGLLISVDARNPLVLTYEGKPI